MMERSPQVLALFAQNLMAVETDQDPAHRLCEAARRTLGADAASLTIKLGDGRWSEPCATDPVTEHFEHLQQLAGEGPADDAASSGRPVFVQVEQRGLDLWSTLSVVAGRDAVRGNYWVVPMRPLEATVGLLTLQRESGSLLQEARAVQFVADTVGTALFRDSGLTELGLSVSEEWTESRVVHQATGMVTAQLRVSPRDALAMLRAHAFSQDVDLHTLAVDVVARRIDFSALRD